MLTLRKFFFLIFVHRSLSLPKFCDITTKLRDSLDLIIILKFSYKFGCHFKFWGENLGKPLHGRQWYIEKCYIRDRVALRENIDKVKKCTSVFIIVWEILRWKLLRFPDFCCSIRPRSSNQFLLSITTLSSNLSHFRKANLSSLFYFFFFFS